MPFEPYTIYGTVLDDDGVTPRSGVSLNMKNLTTGETITGITNSLGQFSMNCADFTSGYSDGDYVLVSTDSSGNNGQDLRIKFVSRGIGQVNDLDVSYTIRN